MAPPPTLSIWPVTQAAASLAKNVQAEPMSWGAPRRPIGMRHWVSSASVSANGGAYQRRCLDRHR